MINTKLNRPDIGNRSIARPRLIARLNEGIERRVTLISAAAGFGKTTLACQWLDQSPVRWAWLSLESEDSDPERFLRYMVGAVQTAVPEFGAKITRLLSAVRLPPPEYLVDVMVSELGALDNPVLLVLDDFYTIHSQPVQQMMLRMVTHLPRNTHFAVLTRVDPPWPLARWRTSAWLNELRVADLSFSKEETERFFEGKDLKSEAVRSLHQRTEGWIAGLQLLKLSLGDAKDPDQFARDFSDSDRLIIDYLIDEVISRQPRDMINFLSITALFDRFCASLCDFVLADAGAVTDGEQLLARLEQENLFLVPLDRERRWYRYHHLFRDLLKHRLATQISPDQRAHLLRLSGEWFAREGMVEESITHYLNAGDVDAAAALVEEHLHTIIDTDLSRRRLKRLLDLFPPQAEVTRPALLIAHSYVQLFNWNFPAATLLLDRAEELLRKHGNAIPEERRLRIRADLEVQRAFSRYWLGDIKTSLVNARCALKIVPKDHRYAYCLAFIYAAGGYAASGRKGKGLRLLDEVEADSGESVSPLAGPVGTARMAIHSYSGDLSSVLDSSKLMLSRNEQAKLPEYFLGYAHYFQGWVAYERNQLAAAAECFEKVAGLRYFIPTILYHDCLIGLTMVKLALKDLDAAREHLCAASEFAIQANNTYSIDISQAMTMRLAIRLGESPVVSTPSARMFEGNRFSLLPPSLILMENTILQAARAECRAVIPFLDAGITQAGRVHNLRQVIQFLAVKAVALKCAGRAETALRVLKKALTMAKPLGFIRTFLDRGPRMSELMRSLLKKSPNDRYLRELIAAFAAERLRDDQAVATHERSPGVMQKGPVVSTVRLPELSNRELDVLALLDQRLSNKEIAERLYVSPDTVRKHTVNIYRKLEVNKRTKAVAAARQFGILPSKKHHPEHHHLS